MSRSSFTSDVNMILDVCQTIIKRLTIISALMAIVGIGVVLSPASFGDPEPSPAEAPEPPEAEDPEPPEADAPEPSPAETPEPPEAEDPEPSPADAPEPPEAEAPEPPEAEDPEPPEAEDLESSESENPEPPEAEDLESSESEDPESPEAEDLELSESETPESPEAEDLESSESETPEPPEAETPESFESETPESPEAETPESSESETPEPPEDEDLESPEAEDLESSESETPESPEDEDLESSESEDPEPPEAEDPESSGEEIKKQVKEMLIQIDEFIVQNEFEEAKQLLKKIITIAEGPDFTKAEQLIVRLKNEKIDFQERQRLAEALLADDPSPIQPEKTTGQEIFNYILILRNDQKFEKAQWHTGRLIDEDDVMISPPAMYFQIKLLSEEKKDDYLQAMETHLDELVADYPEHECVAKAEELLVASQAAWEKWTFQPYLTSSDRTYKFEEKIEILNKFIMTYPENSFRSKSESLIEQFKGAIAQEREGLYQNSLVHLNELRTRHQYQKTFKRLSQIRERYPEKSAALTLLAKNIKSDYYKYLGIITMGSKFDPATGLPLNIISTDDNREMVLIPGGKFTMGSSGAQSVADEKPSHTVYLTAYYIDKCEVTNRQFEKFVEATDYETNAEKNGGAWVWDEYRVVEGAGWRDPKGNGDDIEDLLDHPVVQVSYFDAQAYVRWAGKRLPTEAEWEKAARGVANQNYPWGDAWEANNCNSREQGLYSTTPVAKYEDGKSSYGCYDLAGNAAEWCADWYKKDYYANSPAKDPNGSMLGTYHVIRGGSWMDDQKKVRGAARQAGTYLADQTGCWSNAIGFRCVKEIKIFITDLNEF